MYVLRGIWKTLNCLFIHATYCVIVVGASPRETKMWAAVAVRENGNFFTFVDHVKTNKLMFKFVSPSGSHTILVYRSYTDTKHRAGSLRQQSFLYCFCQATCMSIRASLASLWQAITASAVLTLRHC